MKHVLSVERVTAFQPFKVSCIATANISTRLFKRGFDHALSRFLLVHKASYVATATRTCCYIHLFSDTIVAIAAIATEKAKYTSTPSFFPLWHKL